MATDLDLDSSRYSISLVVFFIGYVVFEVPFKSVLLSLLCLRSALLGTPSIVSMYTHVNA